MGGKTTVLITSHKLRALRAPKMFPPTEFFKTTTFAKKVKTNKQTNKTTAIMRDVITRITFTVTMEVDVLKHAVEPEFEIRYFL